MKYKVPPKWNDEDYKKLVEMYQDGLSFKEIGDAMGVSNTTIGKHVKLLIADGTITKRKPRSAPTCEGDCDHCVFADCIVSNELALKAYQKQEKERYDKLPPCDQHAIDYRKKIYQKEHQREYDAERMSSKRERRKLEESGITGQS